MTSGEAVPGASFPAGADVNMDGIDDPELAAAIEASYATASGHAPGVTEDELLAEAMRLSQMEEEDRQRRAKGGRDPVTETSGHAAQQAGSTVSEDMADLGLRWTGSPRPSSDAALSGSPEPMGQSTEDEELRDRQLAMAIEASYAAQTQGGMAASEEDLMQQALRMSQMEENARQRAALREQQEQELQESILMDQVREQQEQKRQQEEEEQRILEEARVANEAKRKQDEEAAKRANIPLEPPAGAPGRVDIMVRLPDGKRVRRAFSNTNTVGQIYDYLDMEAGINTDGKAYRLVSSMPRRCFEERSTTLLDAGLQGQCALLVEIIAA